eukprot:COSAG01_NODE_36340_length_519_cov_0.838095_1_plen_31_part_01
MLGLLANSDAIWPRPKQKLVRPRPITPNLTK